MNKAQLAEKRALEAAKKSAATSRKENGSFADALKKSKGPGKRRRKNKK